jgi:hypothetical protein
MTDAVPGSMPVLMPTPAPTEPTAAPAKASPSYPFRMSTSQRRKLRDLVEDNKEAGEGPQSVQALLEAALDDYLAARGLRTIFRDE